MKKTHMKAWGALLAAAIALTAVSVATSKGTEAAKSPKRATVCHTQNLTGSRLTHYAQVSISAARLATLDSSPLTIVAATSGQMIQPIAEQVQTYPAGATDYNGSSSTMNYKLSTHIVGTSGLGRDLTGLNGSSKLLSTTAVDQLAAMAGTALTLSNAGTDPTVGSVTFAIVTVTYTSNAWCTT